MSAWNVRPEGGKAILGRSSVAYTFVDDALAGGHDGTLVSQAGKGQGDLFLVAAAHAVGNDVDGVAGSDQINAGLGDTDVALDADDDAREGPCRIERVEGLLNFGGAAEC